MFLAALKKEFSLVFRDTHSVMVLFFMPAIFIIIMSLAMQDQFSSKQETKLALHIITEDSSISSALIDRLKSQSQFDITLLKPEEKEKALKELKNDNFKVLIVFPSNENDLPEISNNDDIFFDDNEPVKIWFSPQMDRRASLLIESVLLENLVKAKIPTLLALQGIHNGDVIADQFTSNLIESNYIYQQQGQTTPPSSVQQNVPAWLIFSMFFVVIPLSTTLITERQQGTLARLKSMNIPMSLFLIAKIVPYLIINQFQLITMLFIGVYIIPLLGGDSLNIGGSYIGLIILAFTTGLASVGYGLLIAVVVKTTEQATVLGGLGNILLGAIGGIMVPKFIMPDYLQSMTDISPMAWALDGFFDIFLRNGSATDTLDEAGMLLAFSCIMLLLATFIFNRKPYAV